MAEQIAIAEYNPTAAGLAELQERLKDVKYDVDTASGMTLAKQDRRELVSLRTTLEEKRKEIKAPALERCRLIDAEAARIKGEILLLEEPIDSQIKAKEAEIKAEKERKLREEQERDLKIMQTITRLSEAAANVEFFNSERLAESIAYVEGMEVTEEKFLHFLPQAIEAKQKALNDMCAMLVKRKAEEAEEARLEQERKAKEEQDRIEREAAEKELADKQEALRKEQEEFKALKAKQDEAARLIRDKEEKQAEEKRKADEAERERIRLENVEKEKARKKAEREKKKAERAAKVSAAKVEDSRQAFGEILQIINTDGMDAADKLEKISIIAEANA